MRALPVLAGGLAGTFTVALLHESLKKITPDAPRMEQLDMEAASKVLKSLDVDVPQRDELLKWVVAGELLSHTTYFGVAGLGRKKGAWIRGAVLGLVAGLTAVVLPKPLGLNGAPSNRTPQTEAMTLGIYVLGGLAAAAVSRWLMQKEETKEALQYDMEQSMDY